MNKNQAKGRTDAAKGKIKETTGKVTGNKTMEQEGTAKKHGGKAEAAFGDFKRDVKKAAK